ncbi:carbonic anhydrase [Acuticoccus sediminis]|uniref:carbonic anhydrase n=1 Tax=Acuticoccus sediminis TaxID=2184697 RepID=A0A8B2NT13_9HYPH|nr:carbonic anhydrase [Acuticoccus sediminis]RAH98733.1 carbonic anhydrase [Acuticoccus sediminis]
MCRTCEGGTLSRRTVIAGSLALPLAAAPLVKAAAQTPAAGRPSSPEEALQRLMEGNARYVANQPINTDHSVGRAERAAGQQPFAAVVSCSDSRVSPELIFDQGPGDIFVVRVAGNFINEDGLASLEFGAAVLGVQTILVLGHSSCGAVVATIDSIEDRELPPGHLPSLVNALRPAVYDVMEENPADLLVAATRRNAKLNAAKAVETGPILSELSGAGKLASAAGVYDIATGKVELI